MSLCRVFTFSLLNNKNTLKTVDPWSGSGKLRPAKDKYAARKHFFLMKCGLRLCKCGFKLLFFEITKKRLKPIKIYLSLRLKSVKKD